MGFLKHIFSRKMTKWKVDPLRNNYSRLWETGEKEVKDL
jgi:hypothetical protein